MSWSDILYPDNPKRREEVVRKIQRIEDFMEMNFEATNALAKFINKNVKDAQIPVIKVDHTKTMKENAERLVNQIKEVDKHITQIDKAVREKLDPKLYRELTDVDTSFMDRIRIATEVVHVFAGITGAVVLGVVAKLVAEGTVELITSACARIIASSVAGAIAGGIAGLAVDVIAAAIAGAADKSNLKSAIEKLDKAMDHFIPEAGKYTQAIYMVLGTVEAYEKKHKK